MLLFSRSDTLFHTFPPFFIFILILLKVGLIGRYLFEVSSTETVNFQKVTLVEMHFT